MFILMMKEMVYTFIILTILLTLFFLINKMEKWDNFLGMTFECGFNSFNFFRFSYSSHYYIIAILFLYLDLEFCFLLPYMFMHFISMKMMFYLLILLTLILVGLMVEWNLNTMNWKY